MTTCRMPCNAKQLPGVGRCADVPIIDVATPVWQRLEALHAELDRQAAANSSGGGSAGQAHGNPDGQQQGTAAQQAAQHEAAPPGGRGAEAAAAAGDPQAPGRRLLSGLRGHPLWQAWLGRRGNDTAVQHSRRAQQLQQWHRRQQHRQKRHRRTLHQAARHQLLPQRPRSKVRPRKAQPLSGPELLDNSTGLDRRRLAWVSTDDAGQAMNR